MHSWLIFWKTACVLRMRLKWNTKMNISMTIWGFLGGVYDPVFFLEWCPNRWIKHVDGGVGFPVVSGFEQVVQFEGADRAPQSTWRITEIVTGCGGYNPVINGIGQEGDFWTVTNQLRLLGWFGTASQFGKLWLSPNYGFPYSNRRFFFPGVSLTTFLM